MCLQFSKMSKSYKNMPKFIFIISSHLKNSIEIFFSHLILKNLFVFLNFAVEMTTAICKINCYLNCVHNWVMQLKQCTFEQQSLNEACLVKKNKEEY